MLALKKGQKAYVVRHTKRMSKRLQEVADILAAAKEVYERTAELFKKLAAIQLTDKLLNQYLEAVFPRTPKQILKNATLKNGNILKVCWSLPKTFKSQR